ncbi:MAG: PEP-CTERM sorting domain-containing protein [Phycisphaera sp.]|nr:PEP-CTERM sorting domain-containing protein [Phycisphaera sp.]
MTRMTASKSRFRISSRCSMSRSVVRCISCVFAIGLMFGISRTASASLIIQVQQNGTNVVFSWGGANGSPAGTLNLTGLGLQISGNNFTQFVQAARPALFAADGSLQDRYYSSLGSAAGTASSTPFGTFNYDDVSSTATITGSPFTFFFNAPNDVGLYVPSGYTSGDAYPGGSMTVAGTDLATLGISFTSPLIVALWGSGGTADSIILQHAAVPEPGTMALVLVASVSSAFFRRRRRVLP